MLDRRTKQKYSVINDDAGEAVVRPSGKVGAKCGSGFFFVGGWVQRLPSTS